MKARDSLAAALGNRKLLIILAAVAALALALGAGPAAAVAPVVTVEDATSVEYTTAHVEGTVNPEDHETSYHFEFVTQAKFEAGEWAEASAEGFGSLPEGAGVTPVSADLSGLKPATAYHLRLVAENESGQSEAAAASSFETKPVAKPTPSEPQVSAVAGHTASFEGTVDPNAPEDNSLLSQAAKDAYATHWWFTCEPECGFSGPSAGDVEADDDPVAVSPVEATGLQGNKEYTVILHARNAGGEETAQAVFSTELVAPEVTDAVLHAYDPGDTFMSVLGTVNPNNSATDCKVVYGVGAASGNEAPCTPEHPTTDELQRFEFNRFTVAGDKQYKLSFESEVTGDLGVFASPGEVQDALEALPAIGGGNVRVSEEPNADGFYTLGVLFVGDFSGVDVPTMEVLPGTNPWSGETTPASLVLNGTLGKPVAIRGSLTGLEAETEYRYRIVATNAAGSGEGAERSFTTLSPPSFAACPNAAVMAEQHSTSVECRGYEMVSPADKNGANVTAEDTNILAAADGNAAVFQSRGGFAGTVGSGRTGFTQYLSRRGSTGWTTKAITPTPPATAVQALSGGSEAFYFNDDLSRAVMWGFDLPQRSDDIADNDNLYRLDTGSGGLETITLNSQMTGAIGFNDFNGRGLTWGASQDTGVVSFASNTKLLPEAKAGKKNTYEWDHGTLRLAGKLPGEIVPNGGSTPPEYDQGGYRETVSADGSRLLFLSPAGSANPQLYLRRNHTETVWVSQPEFGSPGNPKNLKLQWVSSDDHEILFQTTTRLLAADTNTSLDLYLYTDSPDPQSEQNLQLISESTGFSERDLAGTTVFGASDDAGRIYYLDSTGNQLVFWDHGSAHKIILYHKADRGHEEIGAMFAPGESRVSPDGRFLVVYAGPITGYDVRTDQLYLYDAERDTLACVSCRANATTPNSVPLAPEVNAGGIRKQVKGLRPRYLLNDGRVFFSTPEALVPEDTNGVMDTYVYDPRTGHQTLVSTGKGEKGMWFANASESGDDVFIATNQSLVGGDPDTLTDLYDARVGGGFPEPPPPPTPCVGENCRGPLSSPPSGATPATATFSGPGNRHCRPKRRATKAQRRKHPVCARHRKVHHKKGRKAHGKRQPSSSRAGGRR